MKQVVQPGPIFGVALIVPGVGFVLCLFAPSALIPRVKGNCGEARCL
jgi:hypothetical protein